MGGGGGTEVAFALLTQLPRVGIPALQLSSRKVDRTHPVLMQGISQMQLATKARAKHNKKVLQDDVDISNKELS